MRARTREASASGNPSNALPERQQQARRLGQAVRCYEASTSSSSAPERAPRSALRFVAGCRRALWVGMGGCSASRGL